MADAVGCAKAGQKTPDGFYNLERMLKPIVRKAEVLLCAAPAWTRAPMTGGSESLADRAHRANDRSRQGAGVLATAEARAQPTEPVAGDRRPLKRDIMKFSPFNFQAPWPPGASPSWPSTGCSSRSRMAGGGDSSPTSTGRAWTPSQIGLYGLFVGIMLVLATLNFAAHDRLPQRPRAVGRRWDELPGVHERSAIENHRHLRADRLSGHDDGRGLRRGALLHPAGRRARAGAHVCRGLVIFAACSSRHSCSRLASSRTASAGRWKDDS